MGDIRHVLDGMRVLIVEDESDTRDLLGIVLEWHGASVFLTSNVADGLEVHRRQLPDVIVTDIGMPDYNGYALLAAVRKQESREKRTTPVIVLTAFSTPADRDAALTSGFDAYLTKPFEPEQLVHTIKRLYEDRRADTAA